MKKNITSKKNDNPTQESLYYTNDYMCIEAHLVNNPDPEKNRYIVHDEFSMEKYFVQAGTVEILMEAGCSEIEAIALMVLAKNVLERDDKINNYQISEIYKELLEVQGYAPEKLLRTIAGLNRGEARALFNHKQLPASFDRYFMVDGWETNGLLEDAFCEKEMEDELYN